MTGADGKPNKQEKRAAREARLQAQLRANLRRRKQQAAARREAPEGSEAAGGADAGPAAGTWLAEDGRYGVHCDRARIDIDLALAWLRESYRARDLPEDILRRSFEGSRCYGLIDRVEGVQIGFARSFGDGARLAWLADVVLDEARRGQGLGRWFVGAILADPALAGVRRILLATADAGDFYRGFGFETAAGDAIMELRRD